jgi:hypothetical protein
MSGFFQDLLQGAAGSFFGSPFLRDYTHASKTFRPNLYQNAPKFKYLFHVYFDINPAAAAPDANYGLLVKSVKLPSFNFEVATLNQYNRKRLVQSKIKYDAVDITFHDDNGTAIGSPTAVGSMRNLWKAYYNYYYADGNKPQVVFAGARGARPTTVVSGGGALSSPTEETYNTRNQYKHSITGNADWGYIGDTITPNGVKIPFFKKLNWNLVAGTNGIYVDKNNNFIEGFVGLENIFKFIRIDYVLALDNGKTRRNAIVIGADGLLGSVLNTAFRSDSQDYINRIGF